MLFTKYISWQDLYILSFKTINVIEINTKNFATTALQMCFSSIDSFFCHNNKSGFQALIFIPMCCTGVDNYCPKNDFNNSPCALVGDSFWLQTIRFSLSHFKYWAPHHYLSLFGTPAIFRRAQTWFPWLLNIFLVLRFRKGYK